MSRAAWSRVPVSIGVRSTLNVGDLSLPVGTLSFLLYSAWSTAFFYGITLASPAMDSEGHLQVLRLSYMLSLAISSAAVATASHRTASSSYARLSAAFAGVLMAAGSVVCALDVGEGALGYMLVVVGSVLAAAGTALIIPYFGELFSLIGPKSTSVCMLLCLMLATPMSSTVRQLPPLAALAATSLLAIATCAFALPGGPRDDRAPSSSRPMARDGFPLHWKLALISVLSGFLGIVGRSSTAFSGAEVAYDHRVEAFVRVVGFILLLVLIAVLGRSFDANSSFRPTLPVIISACLLLPFIGEGNPAASTALLSVSHFYLYVLCWSIFSDMSSRLECDSTAVFGWGKALDSLGCAAGIMVGYLIATRVGGTPHFWNAVSITCVYAALLITYAAISDRNVMDDVDSRDEGEASEAAQTDDPLALSCEEFAQQYGLSAREREVLELLAQGRSVPFIADHLCISLSTAKTHAQSIYRKACVHSRQELIDLIRAQ